MALPATAYSGDISGQPQDMGLAGLFGALPSDQTQLPPILQQALAQAQATQQPQPAANAPPMPQAAPDPSQGAPSNSASSVAQMMQMASQPQGAPPSMPQGAPQPSPAPAPDPMAGLPPVPTYKPMNPIAGVLDQLFLGGAARGVQTNAFERQKQAYQLALQRAQFGRAIDYAQKQTGPDADLAGADPEGFIANQEAARLKQAEPIAASLDQRVVTPLTGAVNAAPGSFSTDANGNVTNTATGITGQKGQVIKSVPLTDSLKVVNPIGGPQLGSMLTGGGSGAGAVAATPGAGLNLNGGVAGQILKQPSAASLSPSDQQTLLATGLTESGLNPATANNGSSTGVFQFHPATFKALGGTNINDLGQQTDAAVALQQQNKAGLTASLGRPPTPTELYLAHQQGLGGAKALLTAPPGTNAIQALVATGMKPRVAAQSILNNGGSSNMTTDQFASMWDRKFGQRMATVQGAGANPTSTPQGVPTDPPTPQAQAPAGPQSGDAPNVQTLSNAQPARILTADQVPNGKPGWTYKVQGGDITPIEPEFTMKDVQDNRGKFYNGELYKSASAGLAPLQALDSAVSSIAPGGVVDIAALDTGSKGLNPGGVVRPQSAQMFLDHIGLPEEAKSFILSKTGNGFMSPQLVRQMGQVSWIYGRAHVQQAQQIADKDTALAVRKGYSAADADESPPTLPPVPKWAQDPLPAPNQRQVGKTYWSPKGPVQWTKNGWAPQ